MFYMFESFKRMFGGEKPKKVEMSLEHQKSMVIDIAQRCVSVFEGGAQRVLNNEIEPSRLEFDSINTIDHELDSVLPMLSSEMIEHLRMRANAQPDSSPKSVLKAYIKSKLAPHMLELKEKRNKLRQQEADQAIPIADKIAAANAHESAQAYDLTAALKNRPDQHDVLQGTIEGGLYAGTDKTPYILVDSSDNRDGQFSESSQLRSVIEAAKREIDEVMEKNKAMPEHFQPTFRGRSAIEKSITMAKTLLPVTSDPLPPEWQGKKIPIQMMIEAKRGTPSAQSLLAGFILEQLSKAGYQIRKPRVLRGVSEQGAHAFVDLHGEIIDPSVSEESMDSRKNYPDRFYAV